MSSARDDATLATAIAALHNNVHYLGAIAQMAGQRQVVVTQTVVSDSGAPLLEKGTVLGGDLLALLAGHRLPAPLDAQLEVSEPVDIGLLHVEVTRLLSEHPLGRLLAADLGAEGAILGRALRLMPWPHAARFKMTVVQVQLPLLFEHSVLMAMVSVFLAIRAGWDEAQCARLAAAALLHDVGMLYMSTAWADAGYRLSERERVQLAAHSITGSMVVQSMGAYPFSVEDAVLEHHECMDGSGYPRHLMGEAISPMGRILVVAEVVSAFFGKYKAMAGERLSLALRLNSRRYPAEQVAPVLALLQRDAAAAAPLAVEVVLRDCLAVATVFQYWASCKRVLPEQWQAQSGSRALMWVDARMRAIELSLTESGAHPRSQDDWRAIFAQMPESVAELGLIHREVLWQMDSCMDTCQRRWPPTQPAQSTAERALWTWIHSSRKVLGQGTAATEPDAPQPQ
ncbi:HD-GYP domain-containing protein [Comamonas terrigena]|uniref:HD-GYP domain-containing protein n=1 Tax=Comamonas terrigena TaxID=32013 RepID=UPI0023521350|nr:HD domain-containing phosphohydrolase [Comamonas terrigena]MDH1700473.1 HD domain-containing protein [Comamonas terrigena]